MSEIKKHTEQEEVKPANKDASFMIGLFATLGSVAACVSEYTGPVLITTVAALAIAKSLKGKFNSRATKVGAVVGLTIAMALALNNHLNPSVDIAPQPPANTEPIMNTPIQTL